MTTVVNIKHDAYDVYIGRAGKGQDGYFGNPIVRGQICSECGRVHRFPTQTIPCYRRYFERRVVNDFTFRTRLLELRGRRIGCFCAPAPCHGNIIASWLDSLPEV